MSIIAHGNLDDINGKGKSLKIVEFENDFYINGSKYDKYSLSTKPFSFFNLNQDIAPATYNNDSGPFIGMYLNKTCNLCHSHKSLVKRTVRIDTFGGYIRDINDRKYLYILNNKSYTQDSSIIYKIDIDNMKIVSKASIDNSVAFAGQDGFFIYLYNLNSHDTKFNGIYIYNKLTNTVEIKSHTTDFAYDILYDNYYYSGFTQMLNNNENNLNIINTKSRHNIPTEKYIEFLTVKSGNTEVENLASIYNQETSPDESIQEFNKVNFHVKSYTRYTKYSEDQILVPFFSNRKKDLETFKGVNNIIKFTNYIKNSNNKYEFYKEFNIDISEYLEKNSEFEVTYLKILENSFNRKLDLNIEYITVDDIKYMMIIISNNSDDSTIYNLSGIMLLSIEIDSLKLISFTQNPTPYLWDGHIISNDMKSVYQGIYNDGIVIYKLNEKDLKFESLSFKRIPNLVEFGLDYSENLYTLTKTGEIRRISRFDTIIIDVEIEKNEYIKDKNDIETFCTLTTKNLKGEIIKNIETLKIVGNAVFNNGKKIINVTGGDKVKVPITIKGYDGVFEVFAE